MAGLPAFDGAGLKQSLERSDGVARPGSCFGDGNPLRTVGHGMPFVGGPQCA